MTSPKDETTAKPLTAKPHPYGAETEKCAKCGGPFVTYPAGHGWITGTADAESINAASAGPVPFDMARDLVVENAALRERVWMLEEKVRTQAEAFVAESLALVVELRANLDAAEAEADALKARLARIDACSGERCEGCNGTVEYHDNDGVPLCVECWEELRHAD